MILNGSEQVIDDARRRIYDVKGCQNYTYVDEKKKDQGINSNPLYCQLSITVRHRATKIVELLGNDNAIRDERKKAKGTLFDKVLIRLDKLENKSKYTGVSSSDMRNGAGGFGSNSSSNNRYGGFGSESTGFNSDSRAGTLLNLI